MRVVLLPMFITLSFFYILIREAQRLVDEKKDEG